MATCYVPIQIIFSPEFLITHITFDSIIQVSTLNMSPEIRSMTINLVTCAACESDFHQLWTKNPHIKHTKNIFVTQKINKHTIVDAIFTAFIFKVKVVSY